MSQTFHKAVDELNSKIDKLRSEIRGRSKSRSNGNVVAETGDFAGLMQDHLEDGDRSTVELISDATYEPSETIPVPPKTTLDCNDARIEPAGNNDVLRPWPTARIKDVEIDWSDTSGFDSVGILFLHDASLYNNDIPKPWDEPSPGPTRSWAHGRFGSVHDELDNISISGNRQGKALSLVCDAGGQGGIHFVTGSGIQTERVDTSVHLFREAGAFQNNANMFEIHSEDCRIGVHHEHDPENDDRSHINGNKYMMSWQPDGSQAFSEHAWLNEEGKNNAMHAHPFYWDLSSRHEEGIAPFIFKSPFPDKADFERSGRNAIVAPSNVRNYVEDEVTNMNYEHNRNRVVSLLHLGDIIQ